MGEDENLIYCLHVPKFVSLITQRAQNLLYKRIFDEFLGNLHSRDVKIKDLPSVDFRSKYINASIVTEFGIVDVIREENDCLIFGFYKNIDVPRSVWRAGQLVHNAIMAVCQYYYPTRMQVMAEGGKIVRDLVVAKVKARLGRNEKDVVAGVVPLHYHNGRRVCSSVKEIESLEQEVADELKMDFSGKDAVVEYKTSIAYAWHYKHGVLPGFNNIDVPKGLENKIIRSGVIKP